MSCGCEGLIRTPDRSARGFIESYHVANSQEKAAQKSKEAFWQNPLRDWLFTVFRLTCEGCSSMVPLHVCFAGRYFFLDFLYIFLFFAFFFGPLVP